MAKRFYYGGQAVMEGVMMRGRAHMVTAVRRPNGGVAFNARSLGGIYAEKWRRIPFVRGVVILIESMVLGVQSLMYSANVALEEEDTKVSGGMVWLLVLFSLGLGVAVFFLLPTFLARLIAGQNATSLSFNLVESLVRVGIFVLYLWLVNFMPDIRRVFAYHGAEHKTVNAYEAGAPLETEEVKKYSTAHVRCGTSFLFVVLVIAIVVFALTGLHGVWLMVLSRIVLVPVIAALSYEVIYFGGRHARNPVVRAVLAPGLWLQALTTRQPDDSQIEVAVSALRRVIVADEADAAPLPAATAESL